MSIAVFYINPISQTPMVNLFDHGELQAALERANQLRRLKMLHICISTENPDNASLSGVSSVEGGKTPDGHDYDWVKRRQV